MAKRWLQSVDLEVDDQGKPVFEQALQSILAKLSADPATQTTLAAILAKLTADPATQTTLAAVLSAVNLLAGGGLQVGRTRVTTSGSQTLVEGEPGKVAGLLLLAVVVGNTDSTDMAVTDSDGNTLAYWAQMVRGSGPFIDSPAPFIPAIEAPAGKGISIYASSGALFGLAVWCKRPAPGGQP